MNNYFLRQLNICLLKKYKLYVLLLLLINLNWFSINQININTFPCYIHNTTNKSDVHNFCIGL